MVETDSGAQRASIRRVGRIVVASLAALLAIGGVAAHPTPANAATIKVVIIVGPVSSKTAEYISAARAIARTARSYGASVYEIYSPNATWARVRSVAQGAKVLVYLGHGNGWPSPYAPFQTATKDGLGLNARAGAGNSNVKYYGEWYVRTYIKLARNAVVILNRLCYASGNSEWGAANPSKSVAIQRIDNYGAGFLRAGAKAVFAEGLRTPAYILYSLFRTNRTMTQIFRSSPMGTYGDAFSFSSRRTSGMRGISDPRWSGSYYRSVIGSLSMTASAFRS